MSTTPHPWELAWKEGRWKELSPPLPSVSEFAEYLKQEKAQRILDLGCGAGRHAIFLAKQGFKVTALDVSKTALKELDGRIRAAGIENVSVVKHEMQDLPFIDEYFDAIVSTNVLHHGTAVEIQRVLSQVYRVMRKGGAGFVITLSKNDFRYGTGIRLEPDTYRFTEGDEKGIVHHFFSEEELRRYLEAFEVLNFKEELWPRSTQTGKEATTGGSWAHFHLKIRKAQPGDKFLAT